MISVSRNIHIPKEEVSRCCSMSAKWCCSARSATLISPISLVANGDLLLMFVVVSFPSHHRGLVEVVGRRRRGRHPLQSCRVPGVRTSVLSVTQRPNEVDHG